MEVRLADSAYREEDSHSQHLFLYPGPENLSWLITESGETRFLGSKPWNGNGNVEAVHQLIANEESLGFPYASTHILLSTDRLNLVPQDLYRSGEGMDYFEVADDLSIEEELQRSRAASSLYETLFPMSRGYLLAWQIAFPKAQIRFLHDMVLEWSPNGLSIWKEAKRALFCCKKDEELLAFQVKPTETADDFRYQTELFLQAKFLIDKGEGMINLFNCGEATSENWNFSILSQPSGLRISPTHLELVSKGHFYPLFRLACE